MSLSQRLACYYDFDCFLYLYAPLVMYTQSIVLTVGKIKEKSQGKTREPTMSEVLVLDAT